MASEMSRGWSSIIRLTTRGGGGGAPGELLQSLGVSCARRCPADLPPLFTEAEQLTDLAPVRRRERQKRGLVSSRKL